MITIKKIFIFFFSLTLLVGGTQVFAQTTSSTTSTTSGSSQAINIAIKNPLGVSTINDAIAKIMGVIMKLAIPVIICLFIWTGFQFILAQGDPGKLKTAKAMFGNVIIGSVLVLGAWVIATAIVNTVNLITTGSTN